MPSLPSSERRARLHEFPDDQGRARRVPLAYLQAVTGGRVIARKPTGQEVALEQESWIQPP
jgi:hypothetical protein